MAKKRKWRAPRAGFGEAALKIGGYPRTQSDGRIALIGYRDNKEFVQGYGRKIGCTKIRPGMPGSWISSERCSYHFKVDGAAYSCRGYGDEVAASCRRMKTAPRGLAGAKRRR